MSILNRVQFQQALNVLIVIGIVVEVLLLSQTPVIKQAVALATTRQPEAYTELYFAAPSQLPRTIAAGKPTTFSYRITSHLTTTTTFKAYVTIVENGSSRLIKTDSLTLAPGKTGTANVTFTTPKSNTRLEVIVDLPARHQHIHFKSQS
jgi:hypothetical protein